MNKPKNIFMNLNISNDSNFEADSGYVFQRILWKTICSKRDDIRLFFLGHVLNGIPWHENVTMLPFHDNYNKFATRFHFDWHKLAELAKDLPHMDLVINNQPEHTLAFKMLFGTLYGGEVPTMSYYHYLPFYYEGDQITFDESQNLAGFSAPYILGRNLEGVDLSNMNLVGSQFGRSIIQKAYKERRGKDPNKPIEAFAPPIESELFEGSSKVRGGVKRVLYNQRLYQHYGTEAVIDIMNKVARDQKVQLVITDPTGQRSTERDKLDPKATEFKRTLADLPFVSIEHCETREDYHNLIRSIDLGIAPIKPSALWSMAVADILASGKPVLCPNMGAFPELVPNSRQLLFSNMDEFRIKLTALLAGDMEADPAVMRSNVRMHEVNAATDRFIEFIDQL